MCAWNSTGRWGWLPTPPPTYKLILYIFGFLWLIRASFFINTEHVQVVLYLKFQLRCLDFIDSSLHLTSDSVALRICHFTDHFSVSQKKTIFIGYTVIQVQSNNIFGTRKKKKISQVKTIQTLFLLWCYFVTEMYIKDDSTIIFSH